jgi:hypothetical protein
MPRGRTWYRLHGGDEGAVVPQLSLPPASGLLSSSGRQAHTPSEVGRGLACHTRGPRLGTAVGFHFPASGLVTTSPPGASPRVTLRSRSSRPRAPGPRGASSRIARTMSGTHVPPHVLPAVDAGDPPSNGSPASRVPRRPSNSSPRGEPVCSPAHVPTPVVVQRARDSEHSRSVSRRARASSARLVSEGAATATH